MFGSHNLLGFFQLVDVNYGLISKEMRPIIAETIEKFVPDFSAVLIVSIDQKLVKNVFNLKCQIYFKFAGPRSNLIQSKFSLQKLQFSVFELQPNYKSTY